MAANRVEIQAEWLRSALGELTDKQRFVVECRHGLRDGHEYRLSEIAGLMGVSRHAVQRIYRRALKRLNHAGGLHLPLIDRGVDQPPAEGDGLSVSTYMDCDEPVCLSPLIPSRYGLTHDETTQAVGEMLRGS